MTGSSDSMEHVCPESSGWGSWERTEVRGNGRLLLVVWAVLESRGLTVPSPLVQGA